MTTMSLLDDDPDWVPLRIEGHGTPIGYWNWREGTFWQNEDPAEDPYQALAYGDLGMSWEEIIDDIRTHFPRRPCAPIVFGVESITLPTDENGEVLF